MNIEKWTERALAHVINRRAEQRSVPVDRLDSLGWELRADGEPFEITPEDRLKHTYILGSTGSGKTNLLSQLIEKDIECGRTGVILDLRGDLVDRVIAQSAGSFPIERLHLIDLRRPKLSSGINPFQCGTDPYSSALQIHSILRSAAESWGVQLDETLRCSLIALSYSRRSLTEIPRFLTDASFRVEVLSGLADPHVAAFFERFDALSSDRQNLWVLPVLNKVSAFLSHPAIRSILAEQPPLDLASVLDTPGSVLLVALAADRLHGLAGTFGCLMVSAIENAVMQRVDRPEHTRNPVHLYLDEFENFQSPAFESIIAEGRRFRLGLTLSHQNLHQLDTKLRHSITNNAATRVYFRTGHVDARELGSELESFGIKDSCKSVMHLPIGQAFVIGNGHKARHIQFREAKRGIASREAIAAVFEALEDRTKPILVDTPTAKPKAVKHVRTPRAAKRKESGNAS